MGLFDAWTDYLDTDVFHDFSIHDKTHLCCRFSKSQQEPSQTKTGRGYRCRAVVWNRNRCHGSAELVRHQTRQHRDVGSQADQWKCRCCLMVVRACGALDSWSQWHPRPRRWDPSQEWWTRRGRRGTTSRWQGSCYRLAPDPQQEDLLSRFENNQSSQRVHWRSEADSCWKRSESCWSWRYHQCGPARNQRRRHRW